MKNNLTAILLTAVLQGWPLLRSFEIINLLSLLLRPEITFERNGCGGLGRLNSVLFTLLVEEYRCLTWCRLSDVIVLREYSKPSMRILLGGIREMSTLDLLVTVIWCRLRSKASKNHYNKEFSAMMLISSVANLKPKHICSPCEKHCFAGRLCDSLVDKLYFPLELTFWLGEFKGFRRFTSIKGLLVLRDELQELTPWLLFFCLWTPSIRPPDSSSLSSYSVAFSYDFEFII